MTEQENITQSLYRKFGIEPPGMTTREIFQTLNAFWHHFALHKRKCGKSGRDIISVFSEDCPYPVWHREEWIKNAQPPQADYAAGRPFFEQLWELFQKCPIPHNSGAGSENCEYTDDWWYGKNCYLSHSGLRCEDLSYCYRVLNLKGCQFCVFSFDSEKCVDLINCASCYGTVYALRSRQCQSCAFVFDCRNCADCLFCWNLRDKKYCILNRQLSKEEYEKERAEYDFSSRRKYDEAKKRFAEILKNDAWHKNITLEQCEDSSGDELMKCRNCENCFMIQESEDCANSMRGFGLKDNLNTTSSLNSELIYMSSMAQDRCYNIRFGYNLIECRNMEYCAHCFQSKDCFGCCGLVGKQYYIFNRPYSPEAYKKEVARITAHLKEEGVYGKFFPKYFAACPYDESLAGFYWPLSKAEQEAQGYRTGSPPKTPETPASPASDIPDSPMNAPESVTDKVFRDVDYGKPFRIRKADLQFCRENKVPLSNQYYLHRLKDNFRMILCNGDIRQVACAKTGAPLTTSLPPQLDGRIISNEAYLEMIR